MYIYYRRATSCRYTCPYAMKKETDTARSFEIEEIKFLSDLMGAFWCQLNLKKSYKMIINLKQGLKF